VRPIAVIGAAQTVHAPCREDASYMELAFEAVSSLLETSGWSHDRIDTVVTASSDFQDGRTISDIAVQDACGAALKSASKVSMDGAFALVYGAARIHSGAFRTCLVVAHAKCSEGEQRGIARAAFDPIFQRPIGIDDHLALGLQARRFLDGRGLGEEALAEAAAGSWAAAAANPNAHRRGVREPDSILGDPLVADPLREGEVAPESDGACALLLADEQTARQMGGAACWLTGFGMATDVHGLGDRDLGQAGVLPMVARRAYQGAGITDPVRDLDVVEVCDASSVQTLLWREGLGLPPEGGPNFNPSGGAMGAQPGFATGLVRAAEVVGRLERGEARRGLAHGMTGFVGQAHCAWVLERREN
jgi:acetyl-CoA C-acetyltransferase